MKLKINLLLFFAMVISAPQCIAQDDAVGLSATGSTANDEQGSEREKKFIEDVLEDNLKEIAWAKAGVDKGTSEAVKGQASHSLREHQKIDKAFRNYASKHNIILTDVDGTGEVNFLDVKRKKGHGWDSEWASEMISSHRNMIQSFEDAQAYVAEPELKAIVDKTLTNLRSHLEALIKLKSDLG